MRLSRKFPTLRAAFASRVGHPSARGCLLWQGPPSTSGYGVVHFNRRPYSAHRVAWELTHGPIPDGMFVCHRCDVKLCVNVDHLFLGTQQDNVDDMVRKERTVSDLTSDDIRQIRTFYAAGEYTQQELAVMYGIHQTTISRIILRKIWRQA